MVFSLGRAVANFNAPRTRTKNGYGEGADPAVSEIAATGMRLKKPTRPERFGMSDILHLLLEPDRDVAEKLARHFSGGRWSVFLDVQTPSENAGDKEIQKRLHGRTSGSGLWSAKSRDSDFVLEEAEYGKRTGNTLSRVHRARGVPLWLRGDPDGRT